ncbi:Uncharacterised protein [Mycobacteroides abscessus subsp. abscessus]|nr:Uncharacterised protein [Mycobacteroides abscessus subsp. abscessus]
MGGRPDDLHSPGVGLVVGPGAFEAREEGVVDVDDAAFEGRAEVGGEDLHVPGEDDEFDVEVGDEATQLRLGALLRLRGDGDVVEVVAVELRERTEHVVVPGHPDDVDGQAARTLLEEQRVEAVCGLRDEDEGAGALLTRLQADLHCETVGHLGQRAFEVCGGDRGRCGEGEAEEELVRVGGGELLGFGDVRSDSGEHPGHGVDDSGRIGAGH